MTSRGGGSQNHFSLRLNFHFPKAKSILNKAMLSLPLPPPSPPAAAPRVISGQILKCKTKTTRTHAEHPGERFKHQLAACYAAYAQSLRYVDARRSGRGLRDLLKETPPAPPTRRRKWDQILIHVAHNDKKTVRALKDWMSDEGGSGSGSDVIDYCALVFLRINTCVKLKYFLLYFLYEILIIPKAVTITKLLKK